MQPSNPARRLLPILLGIAAALAGFALLFAAVAFFAPRFLRAAGDGRTRFFMMLAMAALVLLNAFGRMRRRKAGREQGERNQRAPSPLGISDIHESGPR